MKRIGVFLGVKPNAGGMFQYAESILNALNVFQEQGYDIHIAYISKDWENILSNYSFKLTKIRFGRFGILLAELTMIALMPGSMARLFAGVFNPIPKQLRRLHCDHWFFPAQDSLTYQVKLPVVATIHDLMHRYESSFPEVSKNSRRIIRDHRFRSIASSAKGILVDSNLGKQHVIESYGTNPDKIYALPYVPPSHITNLVEPYDFDKRYSLPVKYIFYPAQFWAHKNHKRLIHAASILRERNPDISLVFTGGMNKAYEEVKRYVHELDMDDRVVFMGYVPDADLIGFYRRARAMMMPTFFGPTNIPPLEALVCGCPVAVSRIYAMPEQLGDASLYFDPSSEMEMSNVMRLLWEDDNLCSELIERGYRKINSWGINQFSNRLLEIMGLIESSK